jgi:hypothetical protein
MVLGPGDSTGVQQDPELVVLEVAESSSRTLDLLQAEVRSLGRSVGGSCAVVVQDLLPPSRRLPSTERWTRRFESEFLRVHSQEVQIRRFVAVSSLLAALISLHEDR